MELFIRISKLIFVLVSLTGLLTSCGKKGGSSPTSIGSGGGGSSSPPSNNTDMIFTIETTSTNETFTLPFKSGYSYNTDVNWGDGSQDDTITSYNQAEATHTFSNAGTYTITLSGLAEAWSFNNTGTSKDKMKTVVQLGDLGWTDLSGAFNGCSNLTSFSSGNTDTSNVTDMSFMFASMSSLTSADVSSFDTSNVINMSSMFIAVTSLTTLDLSNFDTSNVTDMSLMFYYAVGLTSLDLTNWDTDPLPSSANWIFTMSATILCNDPDNGGTGATGAVRSMERIVTNDSIVADCLLRPHWSRTHRFLWR